MDKRPLPLFLRSRLYTNGRVREDHAPKSVLFLNCLAEETEEEPAPEREFQLTTVDLGRGVSVYRCVICGDRIEKKIEAK